MIRCAECAKPVVEMLKYQNWLMLYNFILFLSLEHYIEPETRDEMIGCLMTLKAFAYEEKDEEEG